MWWIWLFLLLPAWTKGGLRITLSYCICCPDKWAQRGNDLTLWLRCKCCKPILISGEDPEWPNRTKPNIFLQNKKIKWLIYKKNAHTNVKLGWIYFTDLSLIVSMNFLSGFKATPKFVNIDFVLSLNFLFPSELKLTANPDTFSLH